MEQGRRLLAITLSQPWATLMIARPENGKPQKRIESRGWSPSVAGITVVSGVRLAMHSGKNIARAMRWSISDGIHFREPYRSALEAVGYSPRDPWDRSYAMKVFTDRTDTSYPRLLPLGAVIGVIELSHIMRGTQVRAMLQRGDISQLEYDLGFYDETHEARYAWVTSDSWQLNHAIYTRGYQKLWQVPPEVQQAMGESGVRR